MRKRIFALLLSAAFCMGNIITAAAEEEMLVPNFNASTGEYSVTAEFNTEPGTPISISIYRPGYNAENITADNIRTAVYYFNTTSYPGTSVTFSLKITGDQPAGYYGGTISARGKEPISISPVYYASNAEKTAAMNRLNAELDAVKAEMDRNGIKNVNTAAAAAVIAENNLIYNFDLSGIYNTNSKEVIMALTEARTLYYDGNYAIDEIDTAWAKACALAELNSATVDNIYNIYEQVNTNLDGIAISETGDVKNAIMRALVYGIENTYSGYVKFSELAPLKEKAYILGLVNSASRTGLTDIVNRYYTELGIVLADYAAKDAIEVNKAIEGKEFKKLSDVGNAVKNRIKELSGSGSTGGGGTGGSGGSPTGGSKVLMPVQNIVPENNTEIFDDLNNVSWAKDEINWLYQKGIVHGRNEKKFDPDSAVTREEFVKILISALNYNINETENTGFADVDESKWYAPYISTAVKNNIVMGMTDEQFGVGERLTREDLCTIVYRVLTARGKAGKDSVAAFADEDSISEYAKEAVKILKNMGIVSGMEDGCFAPKQSCTRAQACKIIYLTLKTLGEVN